jgi:predicted nucleotide-binding protein
MTTCTRRRENLLNTPWIAPKLRQNRFKCSATQAPPIPGLQKKTKEVEIPLQAPSKSHHIASPYNAMSKPRLFIGSSKEGVTVARAINDNLDLDSQNLLWEHIFEGSRSNMENLERMLDDVDFAAFALTPDDLLKMRQQEVETARDNVIFEMGLFMGALGRTNVFLIAPRDTKLHVPSDLAGISMEDYDPNRPEAEMRHALSRACNAIRNRMAGLRITNVRPGQQIRTWDRDGTFNLEGIYGKPPGSDTFALMYNQGKWYFQPDPLELDENQKRWRGRFNFGTYGPHTLYIVKASELGIALRNYYREVIELNKQRTKLLRNNNIAEDLIKTLPGDYPGFKMGKLPKGMEMQASVDVLVERPPG